MRGTPLFHRAMAFDYGDAERNALMHKVWDQTPFVVDCRTDGVDGDRSRAIMQSCREKWGDEAWPIHGKPGRWQRGSATIYGWTWFGFETDEMLREFSEQWECRDTELEPAP